MSSNQEPAMNHSLCELYLMNVDENLRNVPSKLGDVIAITTEQANFRFPEKMFVFRSISSKRCPPLSVLRVISSFQLLGKVLAQNEQPEPELYDLYNSCLTEFKTAIVRIEHRDIHLVAMRSEVTKTNKEVSPCCFYCFEVPANRLYTSSVKMLENRYMTIVLDLDRILVECNNVENFEVKIRALENSAGVDTPDQNLIEIDADLRKYKEDRYLLKQFMDCNHVVYGGKVFRARSTIDPVIRLPGNAIVLMRTNAEDINSSMLVRLRPGWEEFKNFLVPKNGKRFDVYACMSCNGEFVSKLWSVVLDPHTELVKPQALQYRVLGLVSGDKKSLDVILRGGQCHPKMAIILDGKNNAWREEDKDQIFAIEEFEAYNEKVASTDFSLHSAQKCISNVRRRFFKLFDELLVQSFSVLYEGNNVRDLPPLDVCIFLESENKEYEDRFVTKLRLGEQYDTKFRPKSVGTSVIVYGEEAFFRTAFIASFKNAFGRQIHWIANVHSRRELNRVLHSESYPIFDLLIIDMDKKDDHGCKVLIQYLRKIGYKGKVVGMTSMRHWKRETITAFAAVYTKDLEADELKAFFRFYVPPVISVLVYLSSFWDQYNTVSNFKRYAGPPYILDVGEAASQDQVYSLMQSGSYDLIVIFMEEEGIEGIVRRAKSKSSSTVVGFVQMETAIPVHMSHLFHYIYRTNNIVLDNEDIQAIFEQLADKQIFVA